MNFKKPLISLTTAALLLSSSMAFAESSSQDHSKQSLVSLGDSITYGLNLDNNHHPSKKAFPQLMADQEGFRVANLSESGWTTTDLLQALDTPNYQEAIKKADYITLNIGSNEFLQIAKEYLLSKGTAPIDEEKLTAAYIQVNQNLPEIIRKIEDLTKAPIVIYTFYNPAPANMSQIRTFIDTILELYAPNPLLSAPNGLIRQIAAYDDQIVLADAHMKFTAMDIPALIRLSEIDIHPTEEGQRVLADLGIEALSSK